MSIVPGRLPGPWAATSATALCETERSSDAFDRCLLDCELVPYAGHLRLHTSSHSTWLVHELTLEKK
eukprot:6969672-Heterocapsa_arctica.AAC.1